MAERTPTGEQFGAETAALAARVGRTEILVGVLAQDDAGSVLPVTEAVLAGLASATPDRRACVLVLDAGSRDGTGEAVRNWLSGRPAGPPIELLQLVGPPEPGRAFRALLESARRLEAAACLYVQADLIGLAPEWIGRFLGPLLAGEAERVFPAYTRTVTEGTLTSNLLAPLVRAAFGRRIQQPLGGIGALGGASLPALLDDPVWEGGLGQHGAEFWLAVEPLAAGRVVVEAPLGGKRVAAPPTQPDLPTILAQAVGPLFGLLERHHGVWVDVRGSAPVPCLGDAPDLLAGGPGGQTDRMVRAFRLGVKDLLPIWEQIMPEETLGQLYPLGLHPPDEFEFPVPLWARVVCDFAVAHHERRLPREHLLRALTPLYLGRVAGFLREAQATRGRNLAQLLEAVGRAFESEAVTLRERWR